MTETHNLPTQPSPSGGAARRMRDTRHIKPFKNFHDLPVRLLHGPSGPVGWGVITATKPTTGGTPDAGQHATVCPPKGRSAVRRPGTVMSVYRDLGVSAVRGLRRPHWRS